MLAMMNAYNAHDEVGMSFLRKSGGNSLDIHRIGLARHQVRNVAEYEDLISNPDWRKFVVLRDPLERLLSAYEDKCVQHRETAVDCFPSDRTPQIVKNQPVYNRSIFGSFIEGLVDAISRGIQVNEHFLPQILWCDLFKHLHEYDFIFQYRRDRIGEDIAGMLGKLNMTQYFYGWGKFRNESLFHGTTSHATAPKNQNRLKLYYTPRSAHLAYQMYALDYSFLNIPYPKWIDDSSTWFTESESNA